MEQKINSRPRADCVCDASSLIRQAGDGDYPGARDFGADVLSLEEEVRRRELLGVTPPETICPNIETLSPHHLDCVSTMGIETLRPLASFTYAVYLRFIAVSTGGDVIQSIR